MTEPHGMDSFLRWFYNRAEEWARDVVIVNSTPIGGDELSMASDSLAIAADSTLLTEAESTTTSSSDASPEARLTPMEDNLAFGQLPPNRTATATPASPSDIAIAASGLIESMAQWAPSAADVDSFANSASLRGQARWSDLAPAGLSA